MKKHYLLPIFFSLTILIISCTKHGPEGPSGNNGAQGPKGDTGAAGANGADGTQGPAGTANVIYSHWFLNDSFSIPWTDSTIAETVSGSPEIIVRAVKFAPAVTTGILDSGIVLSYVRSQIIQSPQLMPWIFSFNDELAGAVYCQMNITPKSGGIIYSITNQTTHDASALSPGTGFEYRYIIIPGGVLAGGRKINPAEMSYGEICKAYHIPE